MRTRTSIGWIAAGLLTMTAMAARTQDGFVGASTCVGCHTEQGDSFGKTLHGRKLPGVKGVEFEQSCESCHGPGEKHAAAAGDKNDPGYATIKSFKLMSPQKASESCQTCHKQKALQDWNVSAHSQNGVSCVTCHTVHKGNEPKALAKTKTETCFTCHTEKRAEFGLPSHHPVLEGKLDCTSCHNPHGGPFSNLKTVSVEETCMQCHAEKAGPFVAEHPPVVEDCSICHRPHGSANERLLTRAQPFLCMSCHKWPHNDTGTGSQGVINNATATGNLLRRGKCTNCHREIHGSDFNRRFVR